MIATAIGTRVSAPSPRASATGIMPAIIATDVIRIGRSRTGPASRSASRVDFPFALSWFVNSTRRMPFFVTSPISMMKPIIAIIDMYCCAMRSPPMPPITANGSDIMIVNGWTRLSNCAARMM